MTKLDLHLHGYLACLDTKFQTNVGVTHWAKKEVARLLWNP